MYARNEIIFNELLEKLNDESTEMHQYVVDYWVTCKEMCASYLRSNIVLLPPQGANTIALFSFPDAYTITLFSPLGAIFFFFFFMNGNTEQAQCALSLVCIPQEKEKKGSEKNKTSL